MNILKTQTDNLIINTLPNDWCGNSIHNKKSWEPHITKLLNRNFKSDSVFVDVGSNYGWHSIKSSPYCNTVYSFEPQKLIHDIQNTSIIENFLTNINLFNCQLSYDNLDIIEKIKTDFGENILSENYFLNCIWIYDTGRS